ncbi:MAG: hypothetical protein HY508_08985 [Acidobacteria bacterium]|nr:hypothetical protein [Acidobacteriota bacterium]
MPHQILTRLVEKARAELAADARALAGQIQKVEQSLQDLRAQQQKLEEVVASRLEELGKVEIPSGGMTVTPGGGAVIEQVLAGVRDLITATLPEQALEVLTDEGAKLGVRSAVFDVRGKAAWGSSARGFAGLSDKAFRGVVVQLAQDTPFRTCFETAGHVDTNAQGLKKYRNILDKLQPGPQDTILLLPVRSAGSVSAIFYADTGGKSEPLPVDALKILSEFAGAQLDRLMALSGGIAPAPATEPQEVEAEPVPETAAEPVEAEPISVPLPEPAEELSAPEPPSVPIIGDSVPVEAVAPPPPAPAAAPAAGFDVSSLSEEEQKGHRDAKRFAKLLVSEIELYNKAKVQDGRKNQDLYKRLKSDIDRSRQTYEKRFGKTVGKQVDYFHEELVRILASSDAMALGSEYPGPTV